MELNISNWRGILKGELERLLLAVVLEVDIGVMKPHNLPWKKRGKQIPTQGLLRIIET